jgi:hypothetical protein
MGNPVDRRLYRNISSRYRYITVDLVFFTAVLAIVTNLCNLVEIKMVDVKLVEVFLVEVKLVDLFGRSEFGRKGFFPLVRYGRKVIWKLVEVKMVEMNLVEVKMVEMNLVEVKMVEIMVEEYVKLVEISSEL